MKENENIIAALAVKFCKDKLDEEYAQLCEKMVRQLGQMPETSLVKGKPELWAASVVYAIGSINFLFDHRFKPYVRSQEISAYFGVGHSSVVKKARTIRDILHLSRFWSNKDFSTQYIKSRNPIQRLLLHFNF